VSDPGQAGVTAFSKTAQYAGLTDLPPLVARAVALASERGFIHCCLPEHGRLLQVLARGRAGGVIGETGTGCGAGLAWMASAVGPETRLVSVEKDADRAAACQALFAHLPNVTVLHGDWRLIEAHGPFDLLVLDGGGGAKRGDDAPADPARLLRPGGTVVLDDFHPPFEFWPEEVGARDEYGRSVTLSRRHWLQHPALFAAEVRVHPQMSVILGTRRAPRPA
jgi:predicted O-methyltransferase YrrM